MLAEVREPIERRRPAVDSGSFVRESLRRYFANDRDIALPGELNRWKAPFVGQATVGKKLVTTVSARDAWLVSGRLLPHQLRPQGRAANHRNAAVTRFYCGGSRLSTGSR